MNKSEVVLICLVVAVVLLLAICILMYRIFEDSKDYYKNLYIKFNNLLCDFEEDLSEMYQLLRNYHYLLTGQPEESEPDNEDW